MDGKIISILFIKEVCIMNKVITLGRQFGSGGRELGRRLAEKLGVEYYDKEILTAIAKHTKLSEDYVRSVVDRTPHSLFPITVGQSFSYVSDYPLQQMNAIYQAQTDIIKDMAAKSDCIIVGRCADYILRDSKPTRLFVYADMDSRVRRCIERSPAAEKLTEKEIRRQVQQLDKNRADYYEYYTDSKWGDMNNYDLCVNTSGHDIKELAATLAKLF